jgi:dCTP deaminase
MILTGREIEARAGAGELTIEPFTRAQLNPNSYDVRLGPTLLGYQGDVLDTRAPNPYAEHAIPADGLVLRAGSFFVGHVAEWIGSDAFVPMLHARLATASLGLFIHVTANLVDVGNHCNFSLHLFAARDIRLHAGMAIAQVSFWRPTGTIRLYAGKYKGVRGPAASQSYKHFGPGTGAKP